MIEQLENYKNKQEIVLLPRFDLDLKDSLEYTLKNVIEIDKVEEDNKIIELINNSKIKKIYLVGNNDFYRFILPRLKKEITVCWIFRDSFSNLSNPGTRYYLECIFEYIDRNLIESIGCINEDTLTVLENAGYNCELINLNVKSKKTKYKDSNSIGILSNDFDPNNNFYNQLASLTFVDYDICKFNYVMKATKNFIEFFKLNCKKETNIDEVMKDNFINLYINFTNTNIELIKKSFNLGIPCLVGNTTYFDKNKYLKEHLVVKSDDDINEIADKINFVKNNREKIMNEYSKLECL